MHTKKITRIITPALLLAAACGANAQAAFTAKAQSGTTRNAATRTVSQPKTPGRALRLLPTAPLTASSSDTAAGVHAGDMRTGFNDALFADPDVRRSQLAARGLPTHFAAGVDSSTLANILDRFPPIGNDNEPGAGCDGDSSSPSIGADVPLSYFGEASPFSNPSLVGEVQLLTSGELDLSDPGQNFTITLPLYRGVFADTGEDVWYIATDTTDESNAAALGLNPAPKLAFGATGRGARTGRISPSGVLVIEQGAVDFSPERFLVPAAEPNPFPPAEFQPGSVGDVNYSPLIKIENAGGHVYNMPVIGWGPADYLENADGTVNHDAVHDSVVDIDLENETVTLSLIPGFSFGRAVLYISTDANDPVAATLEGSTFAPGLDDIDVGNDDSLFSAVERIFITINGPRGCDNPQRQGLNAAVTDGNAPFNVLGGIPTLAADYSPLWDANIGQWTKEAIDAGYRSRLNDEFQTLGLVENGFITGPGGAPYGSTGIIINCPIVHRFR